LWQSLAVNVRACPFSLRRDLIDWYGKPNSVKSRPASRVSAEVHLPTILMAMAEMNILCGLDVGQQVIVRGAFSPIIPLGYAALLPLGSFTFTDAQAHGVSYPPIPVKAVIGVS
jgi:hypothetical protein